MAAVLGGRAGLSARWRFWGIAAAVAGVLGAFQWLNVWDRGVPSTVEGLPSFLVRAFSNKGGRAVGLYSNAITFAEVMALAGLAALGGLPREKKAAKQSGMRHGLAMEGSPSLLQETQRPPERAVALVADALRSHGWIG